MDSTNKVYTPTVIQDQALPDQVITDSSSSAVTSASGSVVGTEKIKDNFTPKRRIAQEVIGKSLDTASKKILGVFEFLKQGAIQIGEYIEGVSGEIKISPNGITAKNKDGVTTFALDGETGNAVFNGSVTANAVNVIDENGLVSLGNFHTDSRTASPATLYSNSTYEIVSGSTMVFTALHPISVMISISVDVANGAVDNGQNASGRNTIAAFIDDTVINPPLLIDYSILTT
jgi:hypothetical protein